MTEGNVDYAFSYAPGKVILSGEHAVVYGYPAVAATLDKGVRIAVKQAHQQNDGPILRAGSLGISSDIRPDPNGDGPELLRKALARLAELFQDRVKSLDMMVESAIPAGRGLGSSAALSVAMIRGVCRFLGINLEHHAEVELAMELEKIFHGSPSGIDHTVISKGGCVLFQRQADKPTISSIHVARQLQLAVGFSSPHGGTLKTVKALQERYMRAPHLYKHLFEGIGALAIEMQKALLEGHLYAVGELMNINQGYLNALGVSTAELEALCHIARSNGALGAKLTGAGCGGAVIALADGNVDHIVSAFQSAGFSAFKTECQTTEPASCTNSGKVENMYEYKA